MSTLHVEQECLIDKVSLAYTGKYLSTSTHFQYSVFSWIVVFSCFPSISPLSYKFSLFLGSSHLHTTNQ